MTRLEARDGRDALATSGLGVVRGSTAILRGVDLVVPTGSVYLLAGANGAGKTTLFRALLGLEPWSAGSGQVLGLDVQSSGPRIRANVGFVPSQADWGYGWMRVGEMLAYHASYFAHWDPAYAARLATAFELNPSLRVRALSLGHARRLYLVMAMAHRPAVLLLDEPLEGLDPQVRDLTLGLFAEHLADTPTTTLLATHHIEEFDRLIDHVGVLRRGELAVQLSHEALRHSLHRYSVRIPDGGTLAPSLERRLVSRVGTSAESHLTIWGAERDVLGELAASGAVVHHVNRLALRDAVRALLVTGREA